MPWFLYLALKQLFPGGKRFPFLTAISVVGVALGVAVLVVVTSVMGGFRYEIRHMIVDTEGDVQVKGEYGIADFRPVVQRIEQMPGVAAATPFVTDFVMLEYQSKPMGTSLVGLDPASVEQVIRLQPYLIAGSFDDLDDDSVILSSGVANSLGVSAGDTLEVASPLIYEKLKSDEIFMPRRVRVAGIIHMGNQQLDTSTVYCTLRLAQDLYGKGQGVDGLYVRLKPGVDEDDAAAQLNAHLPPDLRALTWMDIYKDFLWVLSLEQNMIFFLLLFIVIVAAFSVTSSLLISVIRKTREIGLLGALGARPREVAACFCAQGLFIGVLGTIVGLGLGFGALAIRNDIVLEITRLTQRQAVLERFYQFSELPSHPDAHYITLIIVLTIVISTLAGLLPAWRAARLKPVEALRSE
jgi:lipoprotein-releasing system permease protein